MADHEVGLHAALLQGCQHRERRRDERRLLHRRVHEILGVAVEAELLEVEPAGRAAALEDRSRSGNGLGEVAAHAGLDRPLAWEAEGDLAHAELRPLQRISALPHVNPAPMPVMSTSFPG